MVMFDKPLFEEDCQAWVHGPIYEKVYELFKDFKYNPVEDNRFAIFKERFIEPVAMLYSTNLMNIILDGLIQKNTIVCLNKCCISAH